MRLLQHLLSRFWPNAPQQAEGSMPQLSGLENHSQALREQRGLLGELQLLQLAQGLQYAAQRRGHYNPAAAEALIGIGDALELHHGWDPLMVDAWLERLGLWDQECRAEAASSGSATGTRRLSLRCRAKQLTSPTNLVEGGRRLQVWGNGSPEIRTQDQSVTSRQAKP
ncbi:MAG: hypothetical protein ACKO5F_02040 [Synechococcus sp.]